jgi:hypothetical protein
LVLARNALPVLGVYWLGWSANLVIFQLWFDGATALGAMLAFQIRAFARRGGKPFEVPPGMPPTTLPFVLAVAWLLIWLLPGIPYWFILLFFSTVVFEGGIWNLPLGEFGVMAALAFVVISNVVEEARRGYERMSDAEIRLEFN